MGGMFYDFTVSGGATQFLVGVPTWGSHLQFILDGRSDYAGSTLSQVFIQFNADTATNYAYQLSRARITTVSSFEAITQSNILIGHISSTTTGAGCVGSCVVTIPNFRSTTFDKQVKSLAYSNLSFASGDQYLHDIAGVWNSTTAIIIVKFFLDNGNFLTGTHLTGYVLGP